MSSQFPETFVEAARYFAAPEVCFDFVEKLRWPDGVTCPKCSSRNLSFLEKRQLWKCKSCKKQFSIKAGTIFEDSPISLDKWLLTFWLITNSRNGISSYEVSRSIGVTQKTAWFMLHRIREVLQHGTIEKASGTIESDETYIGGKEKNKHADKKLKKGRGAVGKTAVMGILERSNDVSQVRTKVIVGPTRKVLHAEIERNVKLDSRVYTDSFVAYQGLAEKYDHKSVDHSRGEYVREDVHTNGIENYWSLLKRGLKGTYVSVEPFHLNRYLSEQDFRFNNRKGSDASRFVLSVSNVSGKRLTYEQLTTEYQAYYDTLTW